MRVTGRSERKTAEKVAEKWGNGKGKGRGWEERASLSTTFK